MNLILLRHGEAIDNVKSLISDKEIYWSTLTENGIKTVLESIKGLPKVIDKIYVSPLPRTIETAKYVSDLFPNVEVVIENRIREIYHGKYTHKENNVELDNVRLKQIEGDYFIRLGEYGENNYEIESRLCSFLDDIYKNNFENNTIAIVSHGSITSYIKRILKIKSPHIETGKMEIFNDVNFAPLYERKRKLNKIKRNKINCRLEKINDLNVNYLLKNNLISLVKKEFDNIEFSDDVFERYVDGLKTNNLKQISNPKFDGDIILVCFYAEFEDFAEKWINHYLNIGIKNFVLVNNNSNKETDKILKKYSDIANISFWKLEEEYNCYNMCGWKQKIFEYYGVDKYYLTVDSDELFIYKDYKNVKIEDFVRNNKVDIVKALMLDVYSSNKLYEGNIEDYKYVDFGTYKVTSNNSYGNRFYGGPRSRTFGINPSLQKIPLIKYTGKEFFANDHYYYPFNINKKAKYCAYLLHYKFLPKDKTKYLTYARDGRHWNSSSEYKMYSDAKMNNISFYDKDISILIDNIKFDF